MESSPSESTSASSGLGQFDQLFDDYVCSSQIDSGASDLPEFACDDKLVSTDDLTAETLRPLNARESDLPHQASSPPTKPESETSPFSIYWKLDAKAAINDAELLSLEGRSAQISPFIPRFSSSSFSHTSTRPKNRHHQPSYLTFRPRRVEPRCRHSHQRSIRSATARLQAIHSPHSEWTDEWIRRREMQSINHFPPSHRSSSSIDSDSVMQAFHMSPSSQTSEQALLIDDDVSPRQSLSKGRPHSSRHMSDTAISSRRTSVPFAENFSNPMTPRQSISHSTQHSPTQKHSAPAWTPLISDEQYDSAFAFPTSSFMLDDQWLCSDTGAVPHTGLPPQSQPCASASNFSGHAYSLTSSNGAVGRHHSRSSISHHGMPEGHIIPPHHRRRSIVTDRAGVVQFDNPFSAPPHLINFGYAEAHVLPSSPPSTSHRTMSSSSTKRRSSKHGSSRRRKGSSTIRTDKNSEGSKAQSSTKSTSSPAPNGGFVNWTPSDSNKILKGVAPSGSSKTKARREREAREAEENFKARTIRAAQNGTLAVLMAAENISTPSSSSTPSLFDQALQA